MHSLVRHKKIILTALLVTIITGGFFVLGAPKAHAGTLVNGILNIGFGAVISLLKILSATALWITSWFVWLGAMLMDAAFAVEDFTSNVPAIRSGWEICRGLCNMFFALALLLMAFATILRIEKYGMKEYLVKIVVAALLINFSLVIAGIFIDAAQIFTHYFIEAAGGTKHSISAQLMNGLNVQNTLSVSDFYNGQDTGEVGKNIAQNGGKGFGVIVSAIFGVIVMLITAFTLLAAAIFLIVRIVVIWLLLIFSPFAWLSFALPGKAGSLWDKWWGNFLKWVFFAPIYAFFVYLTTLLIGTGGTSTIAAIFKTSEEGIASAGGFTGIMSSMFKGGMQMLLQYIVIIIVLLGGLFVAQSFGIYGAKGVMNFGKWMTSAAGGFAQRKLMEGAKNEKDTKWGKFRRFSAYLAPDTWKEGWKKRREQKEKEAKGVATGAAQDLFNKALSGWQEKTDYKIRAQRARIAEEEKDIQSENAEELVAGYMKAAELGNFEKMGAYLKKLARQNDQNELLRHLNDKQGTDYSMDAAGMAQFMEQQMVPKMGRQQAYRLGHDVNRIMEGNGQWSGRGFSVNPETGEYSLSRISEQAAKDAGYSFEGMADDKKKIELEKINNLYRSSAGKSYKDLNDEEKKARTAFSNQASALGDIEWSKQDPQVQARQTGRFSYIRETYGPQGKTIDTGLTDSGKKKIALISSKHAGRAHSHSRASWMINHGEEVQEINAGLYSALMDDYADQIQGLTKEQKDDYFKRIGEYAPSVVGISDEDRIDRFRNSVENWKEEKKRKTEAAAEAEKNKQQQKPEPEINAREKAEKEWQERTKK